MDYSFAKTPETFTGIGCVHCDCSIESVRDSNVLVPAANRAFARHASVHFGMVLSKFSPGNVFPGTFFDARNIDCSGNVAVAPETSRIAVAFSHDMGSASCRASHCHLCDGGNTDPQQSGVCVVGGANSLQTAVQRTLSEPIPPSV